LLQEQADTFANSKGKTGWLHRKESLTISRGKSVHDCFLTSEFYQHSEGGFIGPNGVGCVNAPRIREEGFFEISQGYRLQRPPLLSLAFTE